MRQGKKFEKNNLACATRELMLVNCIQVPEDTRNSCFCSAVTPQRLVHSSKPGKWDRVTCEMRDPHGWAGFAMRCDPVEILGIFGNDRTLRSTIVTSGIFQSLARATELG